MQGNPVHGGHIALFEEALDHSDSLDLFLSKRRQRPKDLPYDVRKESVYVAMQNHSWADRVRVLDDEAIANSYQGIRADLYGVLAMGSDVANHLVSPTSKYKPGEANYFLSYARLLVLQRVGALLGQEQEDTLRERVQELIVCPPKSPFSSSDLRQNYRRGEDISQQMPPNVWPVIAPYVECFHREQK